MKFNYDTGCQTKLFLYPKNHFDLKNSILANSTFFDDFWRENTIVYDSVQQCTIVYNSVQ